MPLPEFRADVYSKFEINSSQTCYVGEVRSGRGKRASGLERLREKLSQPQDREETELFELIAEQVVERRGAWNLSQKELADLCGTTQSAIARVESGLRPPRIDTLNRIASALDCELVVELKPRTNPPRKEADG